MPVPPPWAVRRKRCSSVVFPLRVIQGGSDADFTIVDMYEVGTFRHEDMLSRTGHTSWVGMSTTGAATYGVVRGRIVMKHGQVTGEQGYGRFTPGTAATPA